MKTMTPAEVRRVQLDLLRQLKAVCAANGLRYALCGGTLLGAVRHGGFIPWDDDIDVMMPRPDYNAFVQAVRRTDSRRIFTNATHDGYYYPFAKLSDPSTVFMERDAPPIHGLGVNIDIVPLDGYPAGRLPRAMRMARITLFKYGWRFAVFDNVYKSPSRVKGMIKTRLAIICRRRGWRPWLLRLERALAARALEDSAMAGFPLVYGSRELLPSTVYQTYTRIAFEGEMYAAPAAYDAYLTALYGDYRTLPPPEARRSHHHFEAFWRDTP